LSTCLLHKNENIKIHKIVILRVFVSLRQFENRVLREDIWDHEGGSNRDWRRLHNEELHNLYSPPHIILAMKSRKMRWVGHVARMGRGEVYTGFWWGKQRKRDHLKDLDIDSSIILKRIF
jgi:hypothetical protein